MANKTFNNIQIFENFLHDVQNGVWGETKQPPEVLFSNLDPSGNTNLAVELAKIYSWATEMFDFQPYTLLESQPSGTWDPTQHYKIVNGRYVRGTAGDPWATDTWYDLSEQPIMIDESALPELGHTYEFRTSTSDMAAFDVREDGGAWQSIAVKLVDTDGKVFEAVLPKYRCVPAHESSASAAAGSYDGFLLQISRNWQLPVEQQTWTTVSDISISSQLQHREKKKLVRSDQHYFLRMLTTLLKVILTMICLQHSQHHSILQNTTSWSMVNMLKVQLEKLGLQTHGIHRTSTRNLHILM